LRVEDLSGSAVGGKEELGLLPLELPWYPSYPKARIWS